MTKSEIKAAGSVVETGDSPAGENAVLLALAVKGLAKFNVRNVKEAILSRYSDILLALDHVTLYYRYVISCLYVSMRKMIPGAKTEGGHC